MKQLSREPRDMYLHDWPFEVQCKKIPVSVYGHHYHSQFDLLANI